MTEKELGLIFGSLINKETPEEERRNNQKTLLELVPYNIFWDYWAVLFSFIRFCFLGDLPTEPEVLSALLENTPEEEIIITQKAERRNKHKHLKEIGKDAEASEIVEDVKQLAVYCVEGYQEDGPELTGDTFRDVLVASLDKWKRSKVKDVENDLKEIHAGGLTRKGKNYKGATGENAYREDFSELLSYIGLTNKTKDTRVDEFTGFTGLELIKELQQKPEGGAVLGSYNSKTLDKLTGGGLKRFQLVTIQATSGGGKTRYGVHLGASSLLKGKNVLHISLEMTQNFTRACYLSRIAKELSPNITGATDADLTNTEQQLSPQALTDICKAAELLNKPETGKLKIVTPERIDPKGANSLENYLKEVYKNFQFDVVILDYLGECVNSSENLYQDLRAIAQSFGKLAKHWDNGRGFLAICLNQLNASGALQAEQGKTEGLAHQGAGTRALLNASDVLLTITQTKEQRAKNITCFNIGKLRGGRIPDKDTITYRTSLGYSYFKQ